MVVLERLHRTADDTEGKAAHIEFLQIKQQVELESRDNVGNLISMFKRPNIRKRLLLGFFLQCLAQSTGVLVVFNYQVRPSPRKLTFPF